MAGQTLLAVPAEDGKAGDHVVAGLNVGHLLTNFFDDPRRLVAEYCRRRKGPQPFHEVQVAVTHPRRRRTDDYLSRHRLSDLDVFNSERLIYAVKYCSLQRPTPSRNEAYSRFYCG